MHYWLLKSEPDVFSIDDLVRSPNQTNAWDGVRNYQARNFMRAMRVGDLGFFYHSNAKPSGIVGIVKIIKGAYPDKTAWDSKGEYYDPKSAQENPRWDCVDVKFVEKFPRIISLDEVKTLPALKNMMLLHYSRLSIQKVTEGEFAVIQGITK